MISLRWRCSPHANLAVLRMKLPLPVGVMRRSPMGVCLAVRFNIESSNVATPCMQPHGHYRKLSCLVSLDLSYWITVLIW